MAGPSIEPASAADAAAVTEVVFAVEAALYGDSTFAQGDLQDEWAEVDVAADARVVRDGGEVVGYGVVKRRGEAWQVEGYVHPEAQGRGVGRLIAAALEEEAARAGAAAVQNAVIEADTAACALLEAMGYAPVRVFREMRITLDAPPAPPRWPVGLRAGGFDPERDARAFHAAHQEAFADAWDFAPRDFAAWSKRHLEGERLDPSLWCVVRDGDEIVAGTISTPDTYGGGFIHGVFTRRAWRGRGVGAALLADAFQRHFASGERTVVLTVDSESTTGAFRLYERAGMKPTLGWVLYEKRLRAD